MFIDSFQEQIWKDKYQYNGETFEEFCKRISHNIFYSDADAKYREELFNNLINFNVLFGGRINSNIGIEEEGLTLFNCFIEPSVSNPDSLQGIMEMANNYVTTLKTEGGVGFCANFLRPSNTLIRKIGVTTPGAIKFLEVFDKLSEVITSGSVDKTKSFQGIPTKNSIRKGATMVTMSICHPDIEEFITAKSIPNKLTKMNMSVLVTDSFVYAVENDLDWDLWFPDINDPQYDSEWDGDFEKWAQKGYPCVIYKTIKAVDLWNLLLKNTYSRNEPGILFIDNARKMDNLSYLDGCVMNSCNPCAEVMANVGRVEYKGKEILVGDICNLGSINITKFYNAEDNGFDLRKFLDCVALMVRALDNIVEVSNYPLDIYKQAALLKRKVGLGITGIGSLLMMADIRYGSPKSVAFLQPLLEAFVNKAYQTSALLAKEKGPFPVYSDDVLNCGFVKNSGVLTEGTLSMIKDYGLRNAALSAIAPNGTLSILAGNVSGGLEPVFSKEFTRWNRVEGQGLNEFECPDVHKGEWFETDYLVEQKSGDEVILMSTDDKYRVDKNNGLCRRVTICDYGYNIAKKHGFENTAGAMELSIVEHLNILSLFSKYIDQSSSKTINLPNDILFEDFSNLYKDIHKYGIKGCTTYREGSTVGILETMRSDSKKSIRKQQREFLEAFKDHKEKHVIAQNVKLPAEYPAKGYILRSEGKKWYLHVAFKDKNCTKPFAVFVNTNAREDNVSTFNALDNLAEVAKADGLNGGLLSEVQRKYSYQKNPVKICRMIGFLLRHNVSIYHIVKALDNVEEAIPGTFVHRIKKFLSQFIDEIVDPMLCPECGEKALVFKEGCYLCQNCGNTKC